MTPPLDISNKPASSSPKAAPHRSSPDRAVAASGKTIWIDLDNTPHIPFFRPIIRELEHRGYTVLLTARDANLCLKCHFQQVNGTQILIGGSDHTVRVRQGTCWTAGCHEAFHGSRVSPSLRF